MEVVSVILSVFSWGHYSEVTVEVEHWSGKIPFETSRDVQVCGEVVVDGCVCVDSASGLRGLTDIVAVLKYNSQ